MKNYYTKKQYDQLLENIVILCAGNEQKNEHIKQGFDQLKIKYEDKALETGDYTFKILKNEEMGFLRDTFFSDEICIERKNSIDELAANMKEDRFFNEIQRMAKIKTVYILIENGCWNDILVQQYRTDYNYKAFMRTLMKIQQKYNVHILFIPKEKMAWQIWEICKTVLDINILKG